MIDYYLKKIKEKWGNDNVLIKTFNDKWIDTKDIVEYEVQMNERWGDFNVVAKLRHGNKYIIAAMFVEYWQAEGLIKQIAKELKNGRAFYEPKEYCIGSVKWYEKK